MTRGWRGIRTPGIPINTSVFKTDSFNRSDIHPLRPPLRLRNRRKWLIYVIATLCLFLYDNMHLGCCAPRGKKEQESEERMIFQTKRVIESRVRLSFYPCSAVLVHVGTVDGSTDQLRDALKSMSQCSQE
ncbi:orf129c (mitochondrion) [Beta vulgaris subsp. vulgaris]|uniref:Orf129c protein n=1 Tax=Beta vulgaris subsp. vulgaris TaxID=3555 RepID=Q9MFA9_BETVV|nr:orf129c [Beta vulgaris subsp. vulgaris]BAA99341.1 orf129c [Beta vulgaris subsp. vulgaris]